ncbi:MAG TPA: DinB family protein [Candidatus Dormibacteraeota bacterium]|nr:DinB family protein [Candidatus Dormibacteraeota bacterium]
MRIKIGIAVICCMAILFNGLSISAAPQTAASRGAFVDTFAKHWIIQKDLAVEVAEAMPAESYDFKPVTGEMSFGEQMVHIAGANYSYCSLMTDSKSPYPEREKDAKIDKASAIKDLGASFDYCTKVFDGLDEAKLAQLHSAGTRSVSTMEAMMGVVVHMAHHRGQAEVYLRLKGITPPRYKS